mmetsp:Transcript_24344/g.29946  ORF Transcript_24344/g.29946 Transcript_24344/m.29946 type:complete len:240 (+) Transcript_24344:104-823(+)
MAEEPHDNVVENAIFVNCLTLVENIRSNKLRKIICKEVDGTNWTQYQRVIDYLIEEKRLRTTMVEDSVMIIPPISSSSATKSQSKTLEGIVEKDESKLNETMEVPVAIVYHLVRKGKKKQRNLEDNTKTKLIIENTLLTDARKKDFDPKVMGTLKIVSTFSDGDEISRKKHINTAKQMIEKMKESFNTNPDHFCRRKAGGTLKEQEETKKRKAEVIKKKKKNIQDGERLTKKKKRTKFY